MNILRPFIQDIAVTIGEYAMEGPYRREVFFDIEEFEKVPRGI